MRQSILGLIALSLLLLNCNKEQNPFEISKNHVGLLTDSTQVKDLKNIYANDSIVKFISGDEFTGNINNIEIFEKGGKKLLTLTPKRALDSTATIGNIRILDERYKTNKNLTTISTFKDIQENYKISRISNLINSIVIAIDEINVNITIDKKELPANLRFDMDLKFESTHIPENAKIKYFFVNWNN
ncbi:hypothetical protein [uncultured Algibacter sp.]|uniref:hypothetical protein n=1 Tax=uncultured Algibacter sp. TaxID=298659 RepID=UPI00262788DB|nr:hypothetical protein [uncultured Algibacter sp.]